MKNEVITVFWDGVNYCSRVGKKETKYWKEIFTKGKGWNKYPATQEEFKKAAIKYYSIFKTQQQ